MQRHIPHALLTAMVFISSLSTAATMLPAGIGEHENSLAKTVVFPEVAGNYTIFLRCEAKVMLGGSVDEIGCYDDNKVDEAFFRAVYLGAKSATVTPALVDGKNVNVLMLLSVIFKQKDEQKLIVVVPNHGTNAKDFGMSYAAPQKYGRANQYQPRTELGLVWVDAMMSANGKVSQATYIDTKFSNKETHRYAKKYVTNNTFIPGHMNGEPTAMRFIKPIFGYRNGFVKHRDNSRCRDSAVACDERSNATGKPRYVFDD